MPPDQALDRHQSSTASGTTSLECPADVAELEVGAAAAECLPRLGEAELAADVVVQLVPAVVAVPLGTASRERFLV